MEINRKIVNFAKSRNSVNVKRSNMIGVMNDARGTLIKGQGVQALITKGFHERTTKMGINDPFASHTIAMESTRKKLKSTVLIRKQRATSSLRTQTD